MIQLVIIEMGRGPALKWLKLSEKPTRYQVDGI